MGNRINIIRKCTSLMILFLIFIVPCCTFNDPVDKDYFLTLEKVRGKNKPEPAPVIDNITYTHNSNEHVNDIIIDFSSTETCDPDSGISDDLTYLIYYSFLNPEKFNNPLLYYCDENLIWYINDSEISSDSNEKKAQFLIYSSFSGEIYFWMTAADKGRESEYSNIGYINIEKRN